MINKVILVGRVGNAPEIKSYGDGKEMVSFSLATSKNWKTQSDEKQQKTEWHNVVAFGNIVSAVKSYVGKGSLLYVEGELETRSWDQNGEKRYKTVINLREMKMLDNKKNENNITADQIQEGVMELRLADNEIPF